MNPSIPPTLSHVDLLESFPLNIEEITERLNVMRKQEDTTYSCSDYMKELSSSMSTETMINEQCRTKMLTWCFQVVDFGKFQRGTVVTAFSYLDLFLSSGSPRAMNAILSRDEYQLACITTLYMAIKLLEPVEIDTATLATLSRNVYTAKDFAAMELDILNALNWRLNGPTSLEFLEIFFATIPSESRRRDSGWQMLKQICKKYAEQSLSDYYFVTQKPSIIAIAIISISLAHISPDHLCEAQRISLFTDIATTSKINLQTLEITLAKNCLSSICNDFIHVESEPVVAVRDLVRKSSYAVDTSPTCVSVKAKVI